MDEPIEFRMRLTRRDFFHYFVKYTIFQSWVFWFLPLGYSAFVAYYITDEGGLVDRLVSLLTWSGIMFVAIFVLILAVLALKILRYDQQSLQLEEKQVRISRDGVVVTCPASEGKFEWARIRSLRITSRLVLLRLTGRPRMDILFARRDIPEESLRRLQELVAVQVGGDSTGHG